MLLRSSRSAMQTSPGNYNEAVFKGLDYLLDEARKRGIRVSAAAVAAQKPVTTAPLVAGSAKEWCTVPDKLDAHADSPKPWLRAGVAQPD